MENPKPPVAPAPVGWPEHVELERIAKRHVETSNYYEQEARDAGLGLSGIGPQVHQDRGELLAIIREMQSRLSSPDKAPEAKVSEEWPEDVVKTDMTAVDLKSGGAPNVTRCRMLAWNYLHARRLLSHRAAVLDREKVADLINRWNAKYQRNPIPEFGDWLADALLAAIASGSLGDE